MHRLLLVCFGLALSQCIACSCFGDDARQEFDIVATAASPSTGTDTVLLQTPRANVRARSITFKNDQDQFTITAHGNELQLRFGAIVIRTNELRLPATLQIENLELQKLDLKPKAPQPVTNRSKL